jgi:hypothetical protein
MRGGGGGFRGGGFVGGGGGFRSGFVGGGGFRGGFVSPGFRSNFGFVNRPFFFPRNRFFFPRNRFFFAAGFGLPFPSYGYPSYPYVDGGYPAYPPAQYDYGYSRSPQVVIYQSDPAPPVPASGPSQTVRPEVREYPDTSSQANDKPIYLIAFKNQDNIRAAEAYWVTGGTLHYVTLQDEQRLAPLDSVDRTLTYRLNRERRVDFRLPPAP